MKILCKVLTLSSLALLVSNALASGYKINEVSVSGMGAANAGNGVLARDASVQFANPAALTQLPSTQVSVGVHVLDISGKFTNTNSVDVSGNPLVGSNGGNISPILAVPNAYYSNQISDKLWVGLGVFAPYGLTTEYDKNWVGRYAASKSQLTTLDINPNLAYKINDNWSLGAGVSARYADVELSNDIDFGATCFALAGPAACAGANLLPQTNDGKIELTGDDWGLGYNIGVLYQGNNGAKIGLHYRSSTKFTLEGDAQFEVPALAQAVLLSASDAFVDSNISASLTIPETITLSASLPINSTWLIASDITHTQWSRFKTLAVYFENPSQPSILEDEEWDNSMTYAIGFEHSYSPELDIRFGIAFDESPVSTSFKRPRIPDADRTVFAFGATWDLDQNWQLSGAFSHIIAKASDIDIQGNFGETLVGDYAKTKVNILSVATTYTF